MDKFDWLGGGGRACLRGNELVGDVACTLFQHCFMLGLILVNTTYVKAPHDESFGKISWA